ncbi:MAG: serine/threonine protein kinase [Acidobacteria bacterium]|nr:serine/threonine protein kinase [Acidobacteriota bacterium]
MATVPTKIGQFEVLRQLGSGGMGAVYLGRDPELDRQVAIKVIREEIHDQEVLDRFFREARAAAALRHPNIITIYASGQHEHQPYMVMEFVDGESLSDIIKKKRSLSLSQKLSYLEQICAGLYVAHRAGIVHRDIKPANVMVDRDGVVRILDFGIARIEGSAMTQDGALMGSLNYMSPEQMLGRSVDHRSDIFSVGSLAYELITYQQAFKGNLNDGLLQRLPYQDPPPLHEAAPDVPWAVEEIIMRALQKAPEHRFPDLAEMRSAIVAVLQAPPPPIAARPGEDDRTVVLPRGAGSPRGAPVGPLTPPSQFMPPPAPAPPPPAAFATPPPPAAFATPPPPAVTRAPAPPSTAAYGARTGIASGTAPNTAAGVPASPTWSVKKKPDGSATPVKTTVEARTSTTPTKTPPSRPAEAAATTRAEVAPRASGRRWVVLGGAAVVLVGAALAAMPWLSSPPPSPLERERPAIEAAMERYRIAYRNRDLPAVAAAFPTLPADLRQTMQRTFKACLVYEVTFDGMQVQLAPGSETQAQVTLRSTHTCTPQSGGPPTTATQSETFALQKNGDAWLIGGVKQSTNR